MEKRLPVPIFTKENIYTHMELKKPTALVLANTSDVINNAGEYMGLRNFIAGCTVRIFNQEKEITDPVAIKALLLKMPNKSAEYIAIQAVIDFHNGEDYISGIYNCPLCDTPEVAKLTGEIDTRDRLSLQPVTYMDDFEQYIEAQLEIPFPLKVEKEELQIESLSIEFPTLEHHHKAYTRYGNNNLIRLQLAVYSESLYAVNGNMISDSWRRAFGVKLFESIPSVKTDTEKLSTIINKYGVDLRLKKHCKHCGEGWQPVVNTSNFFGSALQLQ